MYDVVLSPGSTRVFRDVLSPAVAGAVGELFAEPLRFSPRSIGKPLGPPFDGLFGVRRGEYRVLYEVDDDARRVTVHRIAHRRDAYRGGGPRR